MRQVANTIARSGHVTSLELKNLVRISPYRATWRCNCAATNTLYFSRVVQIGHVCPQILTCGSCSRKFRGNFITDPMGHTASR